jgi:membrane-associated protein
VDTVTTTHAVGQLLAFNPLDVKALIETFGLIGVLVIIFAETGLLVGFFFPGDSLLFLAGVAASPVADEIIPGVQLNIGVLLVATPILAIAGAQLGHYLGARFGQRMFNKPESKLFKREYVEKAEYYFNKFGAPKAVVLARFIPIVRTFLNPVAGMLGMPARQFLLWNIVGGILWTDGILLAGYFLAKKITDLIPPEKIDTYLLPFVLLIILISMIPIFIEVFRSRREKKRLAAAGIVPDAYAPPVENSAAPAPLTSPAPTGPAVGKASVPTRPPSGPTNRGGYGR